MEYISNIPCEIILEKLEQLKCPICLDIFQNVRELPCKHAFCFNCLERYKKEKDPLLCPICKNEIPKRKILNKDAALDSLCSFVRNLCDDIKLHQNTDVKTFFTKVKNKEVMLKKTETRNDSHDKIALSSDDKQKPTNSKCNLVNRPLKPKNTNEVENADMPDGKKNTVERQKKKIRTKGGLLPTRNKNISGSDDTNNRLRSNIPNQNKPNMCQSTEQKRKISEWLHDTKNRFDRFSQTQPQLTQTHQTQDIDMPSVSQIHVKNRSHNKNSRNVRRMEKTYKVQELDSRKVHSADNSPNIEIKKIRRHSLECTSPKKMKKYQNLQEENYIENQLILNLIQDEVLDVIDREMSSRNKNKTPVPSEKQDRENQNLRVIHTKEENFLDQLDEEILMESEVQTKETPRNLSVVGTNKENKSTSSWKNIKKLKKTIGKTKAPKKLDISLQSTQKTKKDETKMNSTVTSEISNIIFQENKTVDHQKMEEYFSKAMPKIIETNTAFVTQEISQFDQDLEANREEVKDNDSDIYVYQTQPLSEQKVDPKIDKVHYATELAKKLVNILKELTKEDNIQTNQLSPLCLYIDNIFKIFNKSTDDSNKANFSEKQIQTNALSFEGFAITPTAAFKSLVREDVATQTYNKHCDCLNVHTLGRVENEDSLVRMDVDVMSNIEHLNSQKQQPSKSLSIEVKETILKTVDEGTNVSISLDKQMSHNRNHDSFLGSQMPVEEILEHCKTQKNTPEKYGSKNAFNKSLTIEISSKKNNVLDKANSSVGITSPVSGIVCSVPQASARANRRLLFEKALEERKELELNLKRVRSSNSTSDSEEERPHKVKCNRFLRKDLSIDFESESLQNHDLVSKDSDMEELPKGNTSGTDKVVANIETKDSKSQNVKSLGNKTQADNILSYCSKLIENANKHISDDDIMLSGDMNFSQVLCDNGRSTKSSQNLNWSKTQKRIKTQAKDKIGTQDLLKHCEDLIEKAGKQIEKENKNQQIKSQNGNICSKVPLQFNSPRNSTISKYIDEVEEVEEKNDCVRTQDLLDHCNSLIAKSTKEIARNEIISPQPTKKNYGQSENDDEFFCENLDQLDSVLEKANNQLNLSRNKLSESLFESLKESSTKASPTAESKSQHDKEEIFCTPKGGTIKSPPVAENKSQLEKEEIFFTPKGKKLLKEYKIKKTKNTTLKAAEADDFNSSDDETFSDVDVVDTTPQKNKKTMSFIDRLSCSQMADQNVRVSLKVQDFETGTQNIVPPPPGFDDDVIMEENLAYSERESENVIPNSLSPQKFDAPTKKRQSSASNANAKNFAVPRAVPTLSQQFMKVSPICKEKSTNLNVIDMVRQSKFSPLTMIPKSSTPCLTSTPKQKSILSYVKSRVNSSQEASTSKLEKPKPCIAFTRLNNVETLCVLSLCKKNLASREDKFTPDVTHMIVSVDKQNYVKDHTIKFISAIAAGIWVVNIKWVQECLTQNTIVDEEPYEVFDITGIPSPKIARLTRLSNPLFKGFKFFIPRSFTQTSAEDVKNIIELLEGVVVTSIEELKERDECICIIICELVDTEDYMQYEEWLSSYRLLTVDINWLSLSVSRYKLLSLRPHLLCSEDYINELGYPSILTENVASTLTQDVTTCD